MAASTIKHDPNLPWGWWTRTVSNPQSDIYIIDENGLRWTSLREAFWCGRLGMSRHNERVMNENLELMLALLASRSHAVENVHVLYDGNDRFYRWWWYWMQSVGLISNGHSNDPFDGSPTPEGMSVIRMLVATRPLELATIPIGPRAMEFFGKPGSATECNRDKFGAAEANARSFSFALVREALFGRPAISMLYRNLEDVIPMARTIWTESFLDDPSRDRMYLWMYDRLDRWTAWGEIARTKGGPALTQHLLALMVLDDKFGLHAATERDRQDDTLAIAYRP